MKKLISVLLVLCMSVSLFAGVTFAANATTGTCGESLTWVYNPDAFILTISGSGAMTDFERGSAVPWYSVRGKIQTVVIGNGVTHIGKFAFAMCSNLTDVTIPNSVTSIGNSAFNGCSSLTSVDVPNSVRAMGTSVFSSCSSLTSIDIPSGVTEIGYSVYSGCDALTSVEIPGHVTVIGSSAFSGCDALKTVTIPNSVTVIGDSAFYSCDALESIVIPDSVESIGGSAFSYNPALKSVTIGSGVRTMGTSVFARCAALTDLNISDGVTTLGENTFAYCTVLETVEIPDSMTEIGSSVFSSCDALKSVTIPDSVTVIGDSAFGECYLISDVYYGGSEAERENLYIGMANAEFINATWHYAKTIVASGTCGTDVHWALDSVGTLTISGEGAMTDFAYASGTLNVPWASVQSQIETVVIEDGVTSIGNSALRECAALTSVSIPEGVTSIGAYAFDACTALTSITIPNSVTDIKACAFSGCRSLTSVTIPEGVTGLGHYAFSGCTALAAVTIPNSVTDIGISAFSSCTALSDVYYGGSSLDWDGITIATANTPLTSARIHCAISPIALNTINGAQIRTKGVQGIRFISNIDKTADEYARVVEFGILLIPSADITDISELRVGATLNGHAVAQVEAKKLYAETDTAITFTAVITDIPAARYTREITARAYAILENGCIVYSGAGASRSIYAVAKRGLENPDESEANKAVFQTIVDAVDGTESGDSEIY